MAARFYLALDLGQAADHTALVVLERRRKAPLRLRYVERMALGTSYAAVVERVRELAGSRELAGKCELVVDGTGVGRAVVDLLRDAGLGCRIRAVSITAGETESYRGGYHRVPKRSLVLGLQAVVQRDGLMIAGEMKDAEILLREMREMRVRVGDGGREEFGVWRRGEHDDLVLAAALAVWGAAVFDRI